MNRVGVGIVTYKRPDRISQLLKSMEHCNGVDDVVVVNDGTPYNDDSYHCARDVTVINREVNGGVAVAKNDAFRYLMDQDCEHIFILDDDILIEHDDAFLAYVDSSRHTGLYHLMCGHCPLPGTKGIIRSVQFDYDYRIDLYRHCLGGFCYYRKEMLLDIGIHDENYYNAWEHVDLTYRSIKAGYLPGFWWFPDIMGSYRYVDMVTNSGASVTIHRPDYDSTLEAATLHFKKVHGRKPCEIQRVSFRRVATKMHDIWDERGEIDVGTNN